MAVQVSGEWDSTFSEAPKTSVSTPLRTEEQPTRGKREAAGGKATGPRPDPFPTETQTSFGMAE